MNLITKFNLLLFFSFAFCLLAGGLLSHKISEENAFQRVTDQAELILQQATETRRYTLNEILPLVAQATDSQFQPQLVASCSNDRINELIHQNQPGYNYKEVVFNPTNPRHKASLQEVGIINHFINNPEERRQTGEIQSNQQSSFYVAYPIKITSRKCLACHGPTQTAPPEMHAIYGESGGFDWHLGEIVGTQMVVIPKDIPTDLAKKTFYEFMLALSILFVLLFIMLNMMIRKLILTPVRIMTQMADDLSKGNITGDELKVSGKDEIADLSRSFNRMRRSIIKIIQILRKQARKND